MAAITEGKRIENAIRAQGVNDVQMGCGAVQVKAGETLPKGYYVAIRGISSSSALVMDSITWDGPGWTDIAGNPVTTLTLDLRVGDNLWEMPIHSCTLDATSGTAIFYKRCRG